MLASLGCSTSQASVEPAPATESENRHDAHGEIRRIERERQSVTIAHDDVPGYMPAMTMPFAVEPVSLLDGLSEGQTVDFTFEAREGGAARHHCDPSCGMSWRSDRLDA